MWTALEVGDGRSLGIDAEVIVKGGENFMHVYGVDIGFDAVSHVRDYPWLTSWICDAVGPMKPALTVFEMPGARSRPWWLWPNLLSLDAPLVALAWQEVFARALLPLELDWMQRGLLAVCVWLAYCGDRLLDARRLPEGPVESDRHAFAREYSRTLIMAWGMGLVLAVVLALQIPLRELLIGLVLLVVVAGYFALHHLQSTRVRAGRWKELMVGVGFAVGTLFFVAMDRQLTVPFLLAAAAWAGLCVMNCLMIAGWDRERDAAMAQHSLAQRWSGMERSLPMMAIFLSALVLAASLMEGRLLPIAVVIMVSLVALLELARRPGRFSPETCHVLADVVLLTPILTLV